VELMLVVVALSLDPVVVSGTLVGVVEL